ncbi:MAG: hypothetical protein AVDCRST_MAG77-2046 [uncultured Chloroflexi bacterium]|uniref:Uncharacterized protein n=1 Tax=uncultured Chloroflexota bacterium TaxID=166587 RepID=A0A6J4IGR0_9CHLR|nr:MAG: hypothetical protein AVDCRST_MAG77-2046 [uncultured Chloroflexota bacterium]
MDPVQLATAAVAVLAPFLSSLAQKAGSVVVDRLAEDAGAGAEKAVDALYEAVRQKFASDGDKDAEHSLEGLAAKPDSKARQAAVAEVLEEKAKADPAFAEHLAELVRSVEQDPQASQFLTQVSGNASVRNIANIGRAGDVTFR